MRISIHQPSYLPWLGYIEKMKNCDVFVYLDTVQYVKNYFDNRNLILFQNTNNGKSYDKWLTIPIKRDFGQTYLEAEVLNYEWVRSHKDLIKQAYKDTPYFDKYYPNLVEVYDAIPHLAFADKGFDMPNMNLATINFLMLGFFEIEFGVKCQVVRAVRQKFEGKGSDLVLDICKKMKADEYYSGKMGKDYLKEEDFKKADIKIIYQEYTPPNKYSAIHQLFNVGGVL